MIGKATKTRLPEQGRRTNNKRLSNNKQSPHTQRNKYERKYVDPNHAWPIDRKRYKSEFSANKRVQREEVKTARRRRFSACVVAVLTLTL